MATQLVPEKLNVTGARLPAAYEAAKTALARCEKLDECQAWANKALALASYARQAEDDALERQAIRIRSRAIRRAGELLRQFNTSPTGGRPAENGVGADTVYAPPLPPRSAAQAAREAGISERQHVTAVRVAKVPVAQFEAAIESDTPPTVTRLAEMGKRSNERPDAPAPHGFSEAIQFEGHVRRLAEFVAKHPASLVSGAVADYSRRELRGYVARCRRYLAQIAPLIREAGHGL